MNKRVFAFLTIVILTICIFSFGISAGAATERFNVGYSIKDVNPYIYSTNLGVGVKNLGTLATDSTHTLAITVQNPTTGKATTERLIRVPMSGYANSTERLSSGIFNDNGDIYTGIGDGLHVTATTVTDSSGTTIVYFTIDAISGYPVLHSDVADRLSSELGVKNEHIFVNGSHSHEAPDYNTLRKNISEKSTNCDRLWRAYYDYMIDRMVEAAKEAYNTRTECKMSKGSIDASEETTDKYQLNYVRNYKVVNKDGSVYVHGSNFGGDRRWPSATTGYPTFTPVSEADDTMHILRFTPTNGEKPIVLVNWRCHATTMSNYSDSYTQDVHLLSADYIASFRYQMQQAGYRVAFLQGAGGNVVAWHTLSSIINSGKTYDGYTKWIDDLDASVGIANANVSIHYGGNLLTRVAKDCLTKKMTGELTPGPIQSVTTMKDLNMQEDSAGVIAAAEYCQSHSVSYPYKHSYNGGTYIINSLHHANNVIARANSNKDTYADMRLNTVLLGEKVAFVTAPTELLDRYSNEATLDDTTDNDWLDIVDNATYGTPFVMAYTNGHNGYTGNKLSFDTNKGSTEYGLGSYEANISRTAQGEGEKIIEEYGRLLRIALNGYKTAYCSHCKTSVSWTPLLADGIDRAYTLTSGHYYLYENVPLPTADNQCIISGNVCLDLNGKTLHTRGRSFIPSEGSRFSIQDSVSVGAVVSHGYRLTGGVIDAEKEAEINLYSGTLKTVTDVDSIISKGGVIVTANKATVNIYGGTVDASECQLVKSTYSNSGCGAAIFVYGGDNNYGALNVYGGQILAGKAEPENGRGDCIFVESAKSQLTLSGASVIDEVYFAALCPMNFKISGEYSGSVSLRFNTSVDLVIGTDIGDLIDNGSISNAKVHMVKDNCCVSVSGSDLVLQASAASVIDGANTVCYDDLQKAVNHAEGNLVRLEKPYSDDITIKQNTYIDLNGFSITGNITVVHGNTLYCMDSMTDDFDVSDKNYGMLSRVTGNIAGIPVESDLADDGYMMVSNDGVISFHRVNLKITCMSLRANTTGVYYKCTYACDEVAANYVSKFGIAMSIKGEPAIDNLKTDCVLSVLSGFQSGGVDADNTGTLLSKVLQKTNFYNENVTNANLPIYGRAYILLNDGTYLFGPSVKRSFRQQVELVDSSWSILNEGQRLTVIDMYKIYADVMNAWKIPNIKQAN